MVAPGAATETSGEAIEPTLLFYEQATDIHWEVGSPQPFVTDAGDEGVSLIAHSAARAEVSYAISSGTVSVTMAGAVPDSS